jgi:sugar/nucleoside kinase (ribokinase family)
MLALIAQVDIVCPDWPSATEVAECDDPRTVLESWSGLGPRGVAVRRGAHGSYVWDRSRDEAWHIPAAPANALDPTGAGNAYGGAFCVGWTETGDARTAGCYGAISASILVRQIGLPPMTTALQDEARSALAGAMAAARVL